MWADGATWRHTSVLMFGEDFKSYVNTDGKNSTEEKKIHDFFKRQLEWIHCYVNNL